MSPVIATTFWTLLSRMWSRICLRSYAVAVPGVDLRRHSGREPGRHHHQLRTPRPSRSSASADRLVLNQSSCLAPSIVRGRIAVGARLELDVVAGLPVAVLALVGEQEVDQLAEAVLLEDPVAVALEAGAGHVVEEGLVAVGLALREGDPPRVVLELGRVRILLRGARLAVGVVVLDLVVVPDREEGMRGVHRLQVRVRLVEPVLLPVLAEQLGVAVVVVAGRCRGERRRRRSTRRCSRRGRGRGRGSARWRSRAGRCRSRPRSAGRSRRRSGPAARSRAEAPS